MSLPAFAGQALLSFDYEGGFDIYNQVAPTALTYLNWHSRLI